MSRNNRSSLVGVLCGLALLEVGFAAPILTPGVWKNITPSAIPSESNAYGMTVDPTNPQNIYYCAPNSADNSLGGVFKSSDGGSTWAKVGNLDTPLHVAVDPDNSNHLYSVDGVWGSTSGFWVSKDGGDTWTKPQGFVDVSVAPVGTQDVYSISTEDGDFNHILVSYHSPWSDGGNCGVLESKDGGQTWAAHNPPAAAAGGYGMAIFFLHNRALGMGNKDTWLLTTQNGKGYFRTTDAGNSWTRVSDAAMTHGANYLYYSNTGAIYTGGYQYPWRSSDNGVTWQQLNTGLAYGWYMGINGDGNYLYTQPTGGGTFYVSPEDDGVNWTPFANGSQTGFGSGTFALSFDPINRIMYASVGASAGLHELWALKVTGSTPINKPILSHQATYSGTKPLLVKVIGNRIVLPTAKIGAAPSVELYTVSGKHIGTAQVSAAGIVDIERSSIGSQMLIARIN